MPSKMNEITLSPGVKWTHRHTPNRVPGVDDLYCIDWSEDQEEVAEIVHGEASAKLMAAAPMLLDALQRLLNGDNDEYLTPAGLRALARAAIAAATE